MLYLWLGLLGLGVGAIGTLIGAGGGFILMPILVMLYPNERPEFLSSVSLAVVFFNALSGTIGYARLKRIDYKAGGFFAAATIPGAVLGALATGYLPRRMFDAILGVAIIAAAIFILYSGRSAQGGNGGGNGTNRNADDHEPWPHRYNRTLGVAISVVVGFLSSLLGIGGGIVHVPALVYLLKFPVHIATATSHFVLSITAFSGTAVHLVSGAFEHHGWRRTLALSVGVVIGAQIGARMSKHVHSTLIMRGLAVALILAGVRILVGAALAAPVATP